MREILEQMSVVFFLVISSGSVNRAGLSKEKIVHELSNLVSWIKGVLFKLPIILGLRLLMLILFFAALVYAAADSGTEVPDFQYEE